MKEHESLFEKLKERLSLERIRCGASIKRTVRNLVLTLVITATLLNPLTACQNTNDPNTPSNPSEDTHQTGGNNGNQNDTEKNPYAEYSEILQNVLTDDYYNNLISMAELKNKNIDYPLETANKYQAIPYGFLEDEGYDIEAIKNDNIKCESDVFVLDNELYIACRVENKASIDYYTHYVIKYSLTQQELSDLNLVHREYSDGINMYRTVSFQAPFFIQELSLEKDAEVLSKAHIVKDCEEDAETNLATVIKQNENIDMSGFSNTINATYLTMWNESGKINSYRFLFFSQSAKPSEVIQNKKIATIIFTGYGDPIQTINSNNVVVSEVMASQVLEQYYNEVLDSKKTATFYNTYDSIFIDMLNPEYNNFYGFNN